VSARLHRRDLDPDPLAQFKRWFEEARLKSGLPNPNAMTLCSVSPSGWPEGRLVLLKEADARGFVFFTNLESDKGKSLAARPQAELVFHWDPLGRQVRIQGALTPVSDEEADAYFASRARESQIAAWASQQSRPVESRRVMDEKYRLMEQKYEGHEVLRPPYWSGLRLAPQRYEFWQADINRFHDRFRYHFETGTWTISRYYP